MRSEFDLYNTTELNGNWRGVLSVKNMDRLVFHDVTKISVGLKESNNTNFITALKKILPSAMDELTDREKEVLYYIYDKQLPQSVISEKLGISPSCVTRVKQKGLDKVKSYMQIAYEAIDTYIKIINE